MQENFTDNPEKYSITSAIKTRPQLIIKLADDGLIQL
jgi:hypothetical protein